MALDVACFVQRGRVHLYRIFLTSPVSHSMRSPLIVPKWYQAERWEGPEVVPPTNGSRRSNSQLRLYEA
jgi:hypothetical protein